jgi:hypothetical protein
MTTETEARALCERLRERHQSINHEAADAIEALRTRVATLEEGIQYSNDEMLAREARVVEWLREQSDIGADIGIVSDKGSTRRAAYGGGSLVLKRAADAIERGDPFKETTDAES